MSCIITGAKGHKVYLMDISGGVKNRDNTVPIDSLIASNDTFIFKGTYNETAYYSISIDSSYAFRRFIIDTGNIKIIGTIDSFWQAKVMNSSQNDFYRKYTNMINPIIDIYNKTSESGGNIDSANEILSDSLISFIKQYPKSYAPFLFSYELVGLPSQAFINILGKRIYPLFDDEIKETKKGRQFKYIVYDYNEALLIGQSFPELLLFNVKKQKIRFFPNKDKIYLIDYWASWCIPCAEKIPVLKKQYKGHHKKGFEIVSISLEAGYKAWTNAVTKHNMPWQNYSALKGFNTEDARRFNITTIPYTILIGKDNKIVKLNPTEEEVQNYLQAHLN